MACLRDGFRTERAYKFPASEGSATHEIDVLARSNSGNIAIECKDMEASLPKRDDRCPHSEVPRLARTIC